MASVSKVILVGNLGADPETRYTASGDAICNVRLAATDRWKDRNSGEKREMTEWHCEVFDRRLAEIAGQCLKKDSSVYIKTRKWQDKDGQDRYTTEIEATEMQMLGGRQSMGAPASSGGGYDEPANFLPAPPKSPPKPASDDLGDDIRSDRRRCRQRSHGSGLIGRRCLSAPKELP